MARMAEIFISYKSERRPAARHLAKVLECYGYNVWYDYGLIPGEQFEPHLMAELSKSSAVIVLWCCMASESEWVLREAGEAQRTGKYLPCQIEPVRLPTEFAGADTISLIEWDGSAQSHLLHRLLGDISRRVGRDPSMNFARFRELDENWRTYGAPSLAQFALGPSFTSEKSKKRHNDLEDTLEAPPAGISANLIEHWKNAQAGDVDALFQVGRAFANGTDGLSKNAHKAGCIYESAATRGNVSALCRLGMLYASGEDGFPKRDKEAVRLYELAAAQGDALAMSYLAFMHEEGRGGLAKSERTAVSLYQKAAEQGIAKAQNNLARMHAKGLGGLSINQAEAARLYLLAAKQGNVFGQHNIAVRYLQGTGVETNEREAVVWFSQAAAQNYEPSLYELAVMHSRGEGGLTKNESEAVQLFKRAARLGQVDAQEALRRRGLTW